MAGTSRRRIRWWAQSNEIRCREYRLRLRQAHETRLHLAEYVGFRRVPQAGSAPVVVAECIKNAKLVCNLVGARPVSIHGDALGVCRATRSASPRTVAADKIVDDLTKVRDRVVGTAVTKRSRHLKVLEV